MTTATLTKPADLKERMSKVSIALAQELRAQWIKDLTDEDNHVFVDFESYFDDDCSLKKLTNFEYIGHPDFEILSVSVAIGRKGEVRTAFTEKEALDLVREAMAQTRKPVIIAQNTSFDGTVLAKKKIETPALLDLMGMSRAWFKQQMFHNLDAIAERVFPNDLSKRKAQDGTDTFKYMRKIPDHLKPTVRVYNEQDVNLLRDCFYAILDAGFPVSELPVLDLTLQMTCIPSFVADTKLLQECYDEETDKQQKAVAAALEYMAKNFDYSKMNSQFFVVSDERDKAIWKTKKAYEYDYRQEFGMGPVNKKDEVQKFLSSNDKFEYILRNGFGVNVPMKESPTARARGDCELIPALGINDVEFQHLMAERRDLKIIWEGRIAVKSNIAAARAETLLKIAKIFDGKLVMPLKYSAAHTDRFGGGDKVNPQNFQRQSKHRYSLRAPEGMKVHVRDSSNVELRGSAAFCEHHEKLALFEAGGDPYITMANKIFDATLNKHDNPTERGVGKATELGCGYGMGKDRFKDYLNAGPLGMPPVFLEDIEALKSWANPYDKVVRDYREQNWPIVEMWRNLERVLIDMTYENTDYMFGPLRVTHESLWGPNGLRLHYPQLGYRNRQWCYLGAEGWVNLFGGKVLENIIQFLCRTIICESMVLVHAVAEYLGGRVCLQVHDEIVTLIWDEIIDEFDKFVEDVMLMRMDWLPTCPLASEADIHDTYA